MEHLVSIFNASFGPQKFKIHLYIFYLLKRSFAQLCLEIFHEKTNLKIQAAKWVSIIIICFLRTCNFLIFMHYAKFYSPV